MGKERCKCCSGQGTQFNPKTGQWERCNCCNGSGEWNKPEGFTLTRSDIEKIKEFLERYPGVEYIELFTGKEPGEIVIGLG
jgi:hypothetical protein